MLYEFKTIKCSNTKGMNSIKDETNQTMYTSTKYTIITVYKYTLSGQILSLGKISYSPDIGSEQSLGNYFKSNNSSLKVSKQTNHK